MEEDKNKVKVSYKTFDRIPDWAIYYMMYGDPDGLTDDDISQVAKFMKTHNLSRLVEVLDIDQESSFYHHPDFGLGSGCRKCVFESLSKEQEKKVLSQRTHNKKDFERGR